MKKLILLILCCINILSLNAQKKNSNDQIVITYKYVNPTAGNLNENQIIVLEKTASKFTGLYYGTTDEFESAREGYKPEFFVLNMDSLQIKNDTINFVLNPKNADFFTAPISMTIKSSRQASKKGYKHWAVYDHWNFAKRKKYTGILHNSTIILLEDGKPTNQGKVFKKLKTK